MTAVLDGCSNTDPHHAGMNNADILFAHHSLLFFYYRYKNPTLLRAVGVTLFQDFPNSIHKPPALPVAYELSQCSP
jgi:hypothetical protein